jgi:hypothetical protein
MSQIHTYHRAPRRYGVNDIPALPLLAYENFETETLGGIDLPDGWAAGGIIYTYAGSIGYEDFSTSTLCNNTPPGPDYGWVGCGVLTTASITAAFSPAFADFGGTVSATVTVSGPTTGASYQWYQNGSPLSNGGEYSGVTTVTLTITGVTNPDYTTYYCAVTMCGEVQNSSTISLVDRTTDWANRVVTNGGASPSVGNISSVRTFWAGVLADGITASKINTLNFFAPDNLIASITPFVSAGKDPWTNHNFLAADLTANGLLGNGSTKYLETGFNPSTASGSNFGGAFYTLHMPGYNGCNLSGADASHYFQMIALYGDAKAYFYDNINGVVINPEAPRQLGFYGQTRVSSTDHRAWFANSVNSLTQIGATDTNAFGAYTSFSVEAFANNAAGTIQQYSGDRMSFAVLYNGFSSTDLSNLYGRVQTLRKAFKGGYWVLSGTDLANEWSTRVQNNGGAAPSGATLTAIQVFWDGLITDGLASGIKLINIVAPDNFNAAITPLISFGGADPWANHNFVSGDLTVNGLVGNGSNKYLDTGQFPTDCFADSSQGGVTVYVYTTNNNTGEAEFHCAGAAGPTNSAFGVTTDWGGVTYGDIFSETVNSGRISASNSLWTGYVSVNKGSLGGSVAQAIYIANSGTAHSTLVSSTTSGGSSPGASVTAFAYNNNGAIGSYSSKRLSFFAIHDGWTSAQSSNFFSRIQTLRTALGGGYV